MADRLTGRVLDSSRTAPHLRPTLVSRVEPAVDPGTAEPAFAAAVALAVAAAVVVGRRYAVRARWKRKPVMAVAVTAGVVFLAVRRPVVSALREHRYESRWSRQPLGW
jgi:hypothetical protein